MVEKEFPNSDNNLTQFELTGFTFRKTVLNEVLFFMFLTAIICIPILFSLTDVGIFWTLLGVPFSFLIISPFIFWAYSERLFDNKRIVKFENDSIGVYRPNEKCLGVTYILPCSKIVPAKSWRVWKGKTSILVDNRDCDSSILQSLRNSGKKYYDFIDIDFDDTKENWYKIKLIENKIKGNS